MQAYDEGKVGANIDEDDASVSLESLDVHGAN